jgi:hypothetical protein
MTLEEEIPLTNLSSIGRETGALRQALGSPPQVLMLLALFLLSALTDESEV